jgi:hypothetical protein
MMKRSWMVAAAVVFAGIPLSFAQAEQYIAGNGKVVHNRLAPVLLHRAVPPFRGQHVYSRSPRREAPKPMEREGRPTEWEGLPPEWRGEVMPVPSRGRGYAIRSEMRTVGS